MKRVNLFRNGWTTNGKVMGVREGDHLDEVLTEAGEKLGISAAKLFSAKGGLLDDLELIRDDEILYVSEGEEFCRFPTPAGPPVVGVRVGGLPGSEEEGEDSSAPPVLCQTTVQPGEWVRLNVGGKLFTTTRSTLTRTDPNSMLARMFSEDKNFSWKSSVDEMGAYLIDRSPKYFEPLLNYLRHGRLILGRGINPEGVLEEAKFFGLTSLMEDLEELIEKEVPADDNTAITRRELVLRLISTPANIELRCQGINFSGANLSKLDLRYVNFKYAVLRGANLLGANLSYCNFERADLSKAIVDSANLLGVKMLCANLESASLKGCNFEDPAGSRANMEGALMKSVNLEGSHMAGVNLRVANLKNANLQNCDLRGAVLAGADLENCDLSGCDLQEANLRGANLKGAAFELMLNPLHMAQTVR